MATPALIKRLAALGADASAVPQLKRRTDGKAEVLYLETVAAGLSLQDGLQRALDATIAGLPIPKVMQYQLADGWTSVSFVRPAHGLVALHGEDIVAGSGAGPGRRPRHARPSLRGGDVADRAAFSFVSYVAQMRDEGAVIASFAERRAEIARQLDAAAAREAGLQADCRRRTARRSDRPRREAQRPRLRVRAGVSRRAAGMPDPDDEGEPEILPVARCEGHAVAPLSRRQQHRARRSEPGDRRQRARRTATPGRRQVLLRPGSQEDPRIARARPRQGRLPRQARHAGRAHGAGARDRATHRRQRLRQRQPGRRCRPRRLARQGRPADRHGRRVSRTAGRDGRLLRAPRRRARHRGRSDRGSLQAALRR